MAVGQFQNATTPSHAVLLVPREHAGAGYRFLIFSPRAGRLSYELKVVGQSDDIEAANLFIRRIRIGRFFDEPSRRRFQVQAREGLLFADAGYSEYEVDIYYWANGSYHHDPIDY